MVTLYEICGVIWSPPLSSLYLCAVVLRVHHGAELDEVEAVVAVAVVLPKARLDVRRAQPEMSSSIRSFDLILCCHLWKLCSYLCSLRGNNQVFKVDNWSNQALKISLMSPPLLSTLQQVWPTLFIELTRCPSGGWHDNGEVGDNISNRL